MIQMAAVVWYETFDLFNILFWRRAAAIFVNYCWKI